MEVEAKLAILQKLDIICIFFNVRNCSSCTLTKLATWLQWGHELAKYASTHRLGQRLQFALQSLASKGQRYRVGGATL